MPKRFAGLLLCLLLILCFVAWARSLKPTATPAVEAPQAVSEPVFSEAEVLSPIVAAEPLVAEPVISDPVIPDPVIPAPASEVLALPNSNQQIIADFDTGDKPNNLGGDFGAWNKDPDDLTQSCTISFETDDALGDSAGYSLKLDYDVESENPAYNGFWMKLDALNVSKYNTVSFYVRGEGLNNFTKRIKIELKDSSGHTAPYIISGITDAWHKFQIPFERFRKIQDWSAMSEFVVVFDDMNSDPQQGTILIDQIAFEKK